MEMKPTNRTDALIITAKTNGTPDLFVPRIITSTSGRDPLVKYMNELFNTTVNKVSNKELFSIKDKYIDDSSAYVEYVKLEDKDENTHSVDMTITSAEII